MYKHESHQKSELWPLAVEILRHHYTTKLEKITQSRINHTHGNELPSNNPYRGSGAHLGLVILFEASTEQIRGQDEGEKRVIQMLPAYVNRSYADHECVREVVKTAQTARGALDSLEATLDPPPAQGQALCKLTWQPCEPIDFFL